MKKQWMSILVASALVTLLGCGKGTPKHDEHDGHDHAAHADHEMHGPHGGELLEVGEHLAHVELIHDEAGKTITLHVLADDAKTALPLTETPKLNLMINGEAVQIVMEGSGSEFKATHDAFAGEPEGRISLSVDGTAYQVPLAHEHHDHDHK